MPPNPPRLLNFIITITINRLDMVDSGIESSELSALETAAADELDGMSSEESGRFVERLAAEAEAEFPPKRLEQLDHDLQELGITLWIQRHVLDKNFNIGNFLVAKGVLLPYDLIFNHYSHLRMVAVLKMVLLRLLRHRQRLTEYNTPDDAVRLIRDAQNIIVLSGAGISVSCGIPDFRSRGGIYASLEGKYGLDKPEDMFDKDYFMANPSVFFDFAHSIFPSNFEPSASHRFIKLLQDKGKLLRNYTQNIDTLEQTAGISRVLQCHGSFATATCTNPLCEKRVDGCEISDAIFARTVPMCPDCTARRKRRDKHHRKKARVGAHGAPLWVSTPSGSEDDEPPGMGVLKPDITFFGEKLSREFDELLEADRPVADLIIVAGTSLKVAPVAELLTFMPHRIPVIVINKAPISHFQSDIMLLGGSDMIVTWLTHQLGWSLPPPQPSTKTIGQRPLTERESEELEQSPSVPPSESETLPTLPLIDPVKWNGADYIWTWPDAMLDILEAMRARQMTENSDTDSSQESGESDSDDDASEHEQGVAVEIQGARVVQSEEDEVHSEHVALEKYVKPDQHVTDKHKDAVHGPSVGLREPIASPSASHSDIIH